MMLAEPDLLLPWLREHWDWIVTRVERRTVRRPEWMAEFLRGYSVFARDLPVVCWETTEPGLLYEQIWNRALYVPRLGRYVAIKLLEYLRLLGVNATATNLRAEGGWSPRATLALLYPDDAEQLTCAKTAEELVLVHQRAAETEARLAGGYGLNVPLFQMEVLLCEYRQSIEGRRQYPGRSLDSELGYAHKRAALTAHTPTSKLPEVRAQLFPAQHLGELQGWAGPRPQCARALADHGYTWSDMLYCFLHTTDFANPVKRDSCPQCSAAQRRAP
jgi:hypothetical protein